MFRGKFQTKDVNGKPFNYIKGDVVTHQGKLYQCSQQTEKSPIQTPKNWFFVGITENTISENPPINPKEGQVWTSSDGISYVWFTDINGSQWIAT
jgi:hypothetical protein